jgi:F0F1-type ATP synthase assembly protein I
MAKAVAWSSEAISIAAEMVVPGLIGLWIDRKLGTVMLFLVLGVALGMTLGLIHLVRLTKSLSDQSAPRKSRKDGSANQDPQEKARP